MPAYAISKKHGKLPPVAHTGHLAIDDCESRQARKGAAVMVLSVCRGAASVGCFFINALSARIKL